MTFYFRNIEVICTTMKLIEWNFNQCIFCWCDPDFSESNEKVYHCLHARLSFYARMKFDIYVTALAWIMLLTRHTVLRVCANEMQAISVDALYFMSSAISKQLTAIIAFVCTFFRGVSYLVVDGTSSLWLGQNSFGNSGLFSDRILRMNLSSTFLSFGLLSDGNSLSFFFWMPL